LSPSAPEICVNFASAGAAAPMVDVSWIQAWAPEAPRQAAFEPGGFGMAAIGPRLEQPPPPPEASRASRFWGAVVSAGLHGAALMALLIWATPVAEPPSPEPVTIEIVADVPTPTVRAVQPPSAPAPPPASPPPVAEAPPPVAKPPIAESATPVAKTPPPIAEPPPPVQQPAPRPVYETPPPVAEPPPPPVAQTPPLTVERPPVTESSPRPSAQTSPPPRPTPTASPAPRRVRTPSAPEKAPPEPRRTRPESATAESGPTRSTSEPARAVAPAVSSEEAQAYRGVVFGRIAAQKRYPEAARERAPHGVAIVSFSIGGGGQLVGASLAQSAGDSILDAEALATVRRASPFPPPPAGAPRNFSAPLSYRVR
jgi:protein TonB